MADKFSSAVTRFSAKFVNELDKDKSVVSSPLSVKFILGLVTLGTTGEGHQELLNALGYADDEEIRKAFSDVGGKLKAIEGVTLKVANKAYVMQGGYDLDPALKEDAVKVFDVALETVNFAKSHDAVHIINSWVEQQTNSKIKDLLSSDSVDSMTRLVLVNAIYFKGTWRNQFNPQYTRDRPFYPSLGKEIQIPMMYKEANYSYRESEELQAQLLGLPYIGEEAGMVVVLPREVDGIDALVAKLAAGYDLMSEIEQMYSVKVQVTIPKFRIETEIDLNSLLPKLGINRIFQANGSGLTKVLNTGEELYVSKAIQKAFIEVNEEGAEAAASTGIIMMLRCAAPPCIEFLADRPFLYMLIGVGKMPLFIGVFKG